MSEEYNQSAEVSTREYVLETDLPAYMNRRFYTICYPVVFVS